MNELFQVVTPEEGSNMLKSKLETFKPLACKLPLTGVLGRILAENLYAGDDLPGFTRATMDGYAVRAEDTFGAMESLPAYLHITGEVRMGEKVSAPLKPNEAWRVATGGMLPPGTDAVVMIEHTEELDLSHIGVLKPVAPGENIVRHDEDIARGSLVLPVGHKLRPQDLGVLAGLGITEVPVYKLFRVGIISTGDEVVEPTQKLGPGQVRDVNSYALYGLVEAAGGEPHLWGLVPDDYSALKEKINSAVADDDLVLVSGGSSVGTRDVTARVLEELGPPGILFHGLSVRPGKPTIGAVIRGKPVFGLPGHPVSAMIVFEVVVRSIIEECFNNLNSELHFPLKVRITRNLASGSGREDYVRVKFIERDGELWAEPVLGKSGLISTMVKADGLVRIPLEKEGVSAGEIVEARRF